MIRPTIIVADDHRFVADACKKLLETDYDVIATVGDGRSLVRLAAMMRPHVVVVDIGMPLLNGLDAGMQVKQILHTVKLIFFTMNQDPVLAAEAFRRGASAYLLKTCAGSELAIAVREVLKGASYLSPAIARDTVDYLLRQRGIRRGRRSADGTAARSAPVAGRGQVDEGGCIRIKCNREHCGISQISNHGNTQCQEQFGSCALRDQEQHYPHTEVCGLAP